MFVLLEITEDKKGKYVSTISNETGFAVIFATQDAAIDYAEETLENKYQVVAIEK